MDGSEAARALGKLGGKARALSLTKQQRVEIARLGGKAGKGIKRPRKPKAQVLKAGIEVN